MGLKINVQCGSKGTCINSFGPPDDENAIHFAPKTNLCLQETETLTHNKEGFTVISNGGLLPVYTRI